MPPAALQQPRLSASTNTHHVCCPHPCRYPSSVSSLSFSHDGALLAVASSYMYEQGDTQHPADAIYIRRMAEPEVKPKPRK